MVANKKSYKVGFVPDGHLVRIPHGAVKRRCVTHPTLEGSFCISVFQNTPRRSNKFHDLISIVTRDPRSARCEIFFIGSDSKSQNLNASRRAVRGFLIVTRAVRYSLYHLNCEFIFLFQTQMLVRQ